MDAFESFLFGLLCAGLLAFAALLVMPVAALPVLVIGTPCIAVLDYFKVMG